VSGSRGRKAAILLALALAATAAGWWFDLPGRVGWRESRGEVLTLYGNVDIRQARLGFRVSGRIAEALVDEGDRVEAGQPLARLDAGPAADAVRAAEAQVASLEAVLDKLMAGPRRAEIEQARAAYLERQADFENAQLAYERQNQLRPSGAASQANLDQATAARDMARARVESARAALRLLEDGTRPEDIAAARANLDAARASLAAARTALADTELHAPSAGVILSRVEEPGAIVASGDVVYVLSLEAPVFVRAYVGEPDLGRIRPGLPVEVTNDTEPGRAHRGTVGFVSPVAEFTPKSVETPALRTDLVYRLRIVVDAPDGSLRQGMPVTVRVPRPAAEAGGG